MGGTIHRKVLKCKADSCREEQDLIASETRISISINGREHLALYCTPLMIRELVVGLIMTEGIAEGICTERMSIVYTEDSVKVEVHAEGEVRTEGATVTSGCVGGLTYKKKHTDAAKTDPFAIGSDRLRELFGRFQRRSDMYNETGCIHSAALADSEDILCFAEDIGRHNAVDKVIGQAIMENIGFQGKLMMASGRLSSEIVSKCARWGIPIVASRTAPTALSLSIAEESGVTVVGFLRGERFNVYTNYQRISDR